MTNSKIFYYARVSTQEQNLSRQIEAFKKLGANERDIITDKASGKDMNRPNYQTLKNQLLRDGDTLIITSLDRLSRNKQHIKAELEFFKSHNIRIKVLDLPTTLTEPPLEQEWIIDLINTILIEVMSSIAEQERFTIRKRQAEGFEVAKAQGKHLGRPKAIYPSGFGEIFNEWKAGNITALKAMSMMNLKRTTFYKLVNNFKIEEQLL